jgi:hypothetical protein
LGDADVENAVGIMEWKRQRKLLLFVWKIISPIFWTRFWGNCIDEFFLPIYSIIEQILGEDT